MAQLNTRLVLRNDIYTAWESTNPILLKGEIGVEYNPSAPTEQGNLDYSVKIKIGDGVNAWNDLPYFGGDSEVIENVTQEVTNITNILGDEKTEGSIIYRVGTLEEAVSSKAEKTEVEEALAGKADASALAEVEATVATKVGAAEVEAAVNAAVETKADTTYVNEELAKKADASVVEEQLEAKANVADVNDALALKANAQEVNDALALKANAADVYGKDEVYTKSEVEVYVNGQIGSAGHLKREIVEALPLETSADADTIYMLKKSGGLLDHDHYEEYMVINGAWELIGDTYVDLTNYATKDEVASEVETINNAIALKADQTALDAANENIAKKADTETVNAALDLKADKEQVATDIANAVAPLAIKSEVEAALELKANEADVEAELAKKADAENVYTKNETYSRQEISDLIADITGGESAADVLAELNTYKGTNDERVTNVENRVKALEEADDDNIIEEVKVAGTALEVVEKSVDIPAATAEAYGVVKLSDEVGANDAGALEVKALNVNKLVQTPGEWLILNGGTASI